MRRVKHLDKFFIIIISILIVMMSIPIMAITTTTIYTPYKPIGGKIEEISPITGGTLGIIIVALIAITIGLFIARKYRI